MAEIEALIPDAKEALFWEKSEFYPLTFLLFSP